MQIGRATVENAMEVSHKVKKRIAICCSNSTSGYLSKENKNTDSKRYMCKYVFQVLFSRDKIQKETMHPSIAI